MRKSFKKVIATILVATMAFSVPMAADSTVAKASGSSVTVPTVLAAYDFETETGVTVDNDTAADKPFEIKDGTLIMTDSGNFATIANPLRGQVTDGVTIEFDFAVAKDAVPANIEYGTVLGFQTPNLAMSPMPYLCYNGDDGWIDIKGVSPVAGTKSHYTLVVDKTGATMYINGAAVANPTVTSSEGFAASNYGTSILTAMNNSTEAYFGKGAFWGAAAGELDNVKFYNTAMDDSQVVKAFFDAVSMPTASATYDFETETGVTVDNDTAADKPFEIKDGTLIMTDSGNFATIANPLRGQVTDGVTIEFDFAIAKEAISANIEAGTVLGFQTPNLAMSPMPYLCYNGDDGWIDIKGVSPAAGTKSHYTLVVDKTGATMYINGAAVANPTVTSINESFAASNYGASILKAMNDSTEAYFGKGAFWGAAAGELDDVKFYNTAMDGSQVAKAYALKDAYDISSYRSGETYTAPTKSGKVFAGWYEDAELTKPIATDVKTGDAYAKFVDEALLTTKCQTRAGTTAESAKADLRMMLAVDSLDYSNVGFDVTYMGKNYNGESTTVYESISVTDNSTTVSFDPATVFGTNVAKYMLSCILTDIPQANFSEKINVTPYWTTLDGTKVKGATRAVSIQDSFNANAY